MIEIKNLYKTYKTSNNIEVKALNDISLKLPSTGMIFILGKSGSGKSTFLNVLGGLDSFDSGDILINENSTKNFTEQEFDSYRNTYVGFVFQEYNLLDDFTVIENINLSIELQGKNPEENDLKDILLKVGLENYENRKPNELSGGERQRIAIARALIKKPQILMADEPSGALDSNTSKQIFDTLKDLSKEKLIIVVSHDRDFAFKYADRIIELEDGKVISDIEHTANNDNDFLIDANGQINIKEGHILSENEKNEIIDFISNSSNNNINFRKENTAFEKTDENNIIIENKPLSLVPSKLSNKNAIKIGVGSFKHKKFKLIVAIILCFISFSFFAVTDAIGSFNEKNTYLNSLNSSVVDHASFSVEYKDINNLGKEEWSKGLYISQKQIDKISNELNIELNGVYTPYRISINLKQIINKSKVKPYTYKIYPERLYNFSIINQDFLTKNNYTLLGNSRLPNNSGEIVITKYIYSMFKEFDFSYLENNETKIIEIDDYNDILNKQIYVDGNVFTIVGILDTNFDLSHFNQLRNNDINILLSESLNKKIDSLKKYSAHSIIYLSEKFMDELYLETINYFELSFDNSLNTKYYANIEKFKNVLFFDNNKATLNDNEVIVSFSNYTSGFNNFKLRDLNRNASGFEKEIIDNTTLFNDITDFKTLISNIYKVTKFKFINENSNKFKDILKANKQFFEINLSDNEIDLLTNEEMFYLFNASNFENDDFYNFYMNYLAELIENYDLENYILNKEAYDLLCKSYVINGNKINLVDKQLPLIRDFTSNINKIGITDFACNNIDLCRDFYLKNNEKNVFTDYEAVQYFIDILSKNSGTNYINFKNLKYQCDSYKLNFYYNFIKIYATNFKINFDKSTQKDIVGIHLGGIDGLVVNDNLYNSLIDRDLNSVYSFAITSMPKSKTEIKKLINYIYSHTETLSNNVEIRYVMENYVIDDLNSLAFVLKTLGIIFILVGLVFAIFASILFSNYIATSISYRKKDIGILRALGARNKDVYKIFFAESFTIAGINFIMGIVCTLFFEFLLNTIIKSVIYISTNIVNFGIRQVFLLLIIVLFSAFTATYKPVKKFTKQKPIDIIRK